MNAALPGQRVLGVPVHALREPEAIERIVAWAAARQPRRVHFVNAHSAVSAGRDAALMAALHAGDLNLPDGAPVAWLLRRLGHTGQPRVSGPDVMATLLGRCETERLPVYLMGGTPETLARLHQALAQRWPALLLAGSHSPPFGEPSAAAEANDEALVLASGAMLLFVGLGCPRQEQWMARRAERLPLVMLGVGAAFDFLAGTRRRAPRWMQRCGLEWLHRLLQEPRRLAPRYLGTNLAFVIGAWRQWRGR